MMQAPAMPQQPTVPTPTAPPPLFNAPTQPGQKPQAKPSQPTFLGKGLTANRPMGDFGANPTNTGTKTLLGQ